MPFAFIAVTFEFINISTCDLSFVPFVSSLALVKHTRSLPFWNVDLGWGMWIGYTLKVVTLVKGCYKLKVVTLVNHTIIVQFAKSHEFSKV